MNENERTEPQNNEDSQTVADADTPTERARPTDAAALVAALTGAGLPTAQAVALTTALTGAAAAAGAPTNPPANTIPEFVKYLVNTLQPVPDDLVPLPEPPPEELPPTTAVPPGVVVLWGYLGDVYSYDKHSSAARAFLRLYRTVLLNEYLEIATADILLADRLSRNDQPLAYNVVWVKPDAEIRYVYTTTMQARQESFLQGPIAGGPPTFPPGGQWGGGGTSFGCPGSGTSFGCPGGGTSFGCPGGGTSFGCPGGGTSFGCPGGGTSFGCPGGGTSFGCPGGGVSFSWCG